MAGGCKAPSSAPSKPDAAVLLFAHVPLCGCGRHQVELSSKKGDMAKAAMSHFHLAGAHSNLGDTDKAIKSYKVCVRVRNMVLIAKDNAAWM